MRVLSATEAIGPAWERTRALLFENFSFSRFLKLCAVGVLAIAGMMFSYSVNYSKPAGTESTPGAFIFLLGFLVSAFIFFVIELILFYCGSRMEFVLFEMIATGNTVIAPMWRRYGRHTWKWIGFKILLMVVGLLTCLACIAPLFLSLFRHPHMEHVGALTFLKIFLPIFIAIMLLCLVLYLAWDFVLPIMALEGPIVFRSVRKALEIFGEAPGAFWGYVFMRLVLGIAAGISFLVAWILAIVAGAIPLAIIGLLAYFSLHHAGTSGVVVLTMLYVLLAVVGFAYLILSYIVMGGMMAIFMQSYAAYFYGGRYQPLGDLLEPPIAPVAPYEAAPPVDDVPPMFPPPETVG